MATDSKRVAFIGGAAVLLGVIAGFLLGSSRGTEGGNPDGVRAQRTAPGPADVVDGVGVGFTRTEQGAVAAAANFNLLSGRDDLLSVDALTAAMKRLAAPTWQQEAEKQARAGYESVVRTYGTGAEVSTGVLAYDVVEFTPTAAVIDLWTVNVLSGPEQPNANHVWGIVTVRLVWTDDDWRIAGIESSPGPAPVELPTGRSSQAASEVIEEFDEFTGPPVP